MRHKPTVSVVLPVHNREKLVRRAIESVLAQNMTDFELVVVDDCSADATAAVVEEYCTDPRVQLDRCSENLGPAGARNRGVELSSGNYIAFQDSDDRWFPEKLTQQVSILKKMSDRQACYCGALYYAENQCYYIPRGAAFDLKRAEKGDLSGEVLYGNPTTPQTLMVERHAFDAIGGFDTSLKINEDWDLAIRLAQNVRFAFVADPLVVIYRTDDSVSSDRIADTAARVRLLTEYTTHYAKHPRARARQNYIIGMQSLENGAHKDAVEHLHRSFRDVPTLKCLLQISRARARALKCLVPRGGSK